ncbi:MAG: hypothetical protein QOK06_382 [Acidimicrobiaceae bacterium]
MTRRRVSVVVAALVVAAQVFAAQVANAGPAAARSTTAAHLIELIDQSPAVEPGGELRVRVRLASAPPGAQIHIDVHARTRTRSDFAKTIAGKGTGSRIGSGPTVPAVADASGSVLLAVQTRDDSGVGDPTGVRLTEGVFPVSVTLVDARGSALDEVLTYLIRLPVKPDDRPLGVAVVVPVSGPPSLVPDGTVVADPTARRAALDVATVLADRPKVPVTLAATPELLDGLANGGGTDTLTALAATMPTRSAAPASYVPVDPAAWVRAGLDGELTDELTHGASTIRSTLGVAPGQTWVADDHLDNAAASALRDAGIRRVVVPEHALGPLDERSFPFTLTKPFDLTGVDGVEAIATDAALDAHVDETGDPALDANHLLADLAILFFDDPKAERAAVFALPSGGTIDPVFLATLLRGVAGNRLLRGLTLDDAFDQVPKAGARGPDRGTGPALARTLTPAPADDLGGFPTGLRTAEADVATLATVLPDGAAQPDQLRLRLLVAGSRALSDSARREYLDAVRGAVRDTLSRISAPRGQTITFTARDGVVALTIRNDTGAPARVAIILRGAKLQFLDYPGGVVPVTLATSSTRIELRVRALASGDSPLDVTLATPDMRFELGHTRITIRSTAFSGVGIILSVGALLFLVLWWGRHIITDRRRKRRPPRHATKATNP